MDDDAYITFRTIDNFVNGYGLTWNTAERVQAYTNPLWLFLLSACYFLTGEIYLTTLFVSIVLSFITLTILMTRLAISWLAASFGLFILLLSSAFVDFSTSGLENPLTHLLLAAFLAVYFATDQWTPRRLFCLSLLVALGGLNRLDALLFYIPVLLYGLLNLRQMKSGYALLWGQFPLLLWFCFATFYYGFPFPNTAYAKLNTAVPAGELALQGLHYLLNSLEQDPLTFLMVVVGVILPFLSKQKRLMPVAVGNMLYLLYVVSIGGDFISGRFLTAPLFVAVALIVRYDFTRLQPVTVLVLFGVVAITGLSVAYPTLSFKNVFPDKELGWEVGDYRKIGNERLWYRLGTGLFRWSRYTNLPDYRRVKEGKRAREDGPSVVVRGSVGMFGFYAGPDVHIIDVFALGDPLLARLPVPHNLEWRIGHFTRVMPIGYVETQQSGQNRLGDKNLALYYDKLRLITRGDLFSWSRLLEIWRMNTGQYEHLIDFETYRYPNEASIPPEIYQTAFIQKLGLVNPTDSSYVYAYLYHDSQWETYRLDDNSRRGRAYTIEWIITPQKIWFKGPAQKKKDNYPFITSFSASQPLIVAVAFSDDPFEDTQTIFERRFRFKLTKDNWIEILSPPEEWRNPRWPDESGWVQENIDHVMKSIIDETSFIHQKSRIINPADSPYVYAYIWNNGQTETYLLDDSSSLGRQYDVEWLITPEKIEFSGAFLEKQTTITALSSKQFLAIAVAFADDPARATQNIYERRFWFNLTEDNQMKIFSPSEEWHNPHWPDSSGWVRQDIGHVMQDR
jgi:arabinofuranosyltransferase